MIAENCFNYNGVNILPARPRSREVVQREVIYHNIRYSYVISDKRLRADIRGFFFAPDVGNVLAETMRFGNRSAYRAVVIFD